MLSPFGSGTEGTVDLAARLGLESAGISIPMARIPEEIESPTEQPTLILIGHEHPLIDELVEDGKLDLGSLEPGKLADLMVLDRNPLVDLRNTNSIRYVMKAGVMWEGDTMDEVWPNKRKLNISFNQPPL